MTRSPIGRAAYLNGGLGTMSALFVASLFALPMTAALTFTTEEFRHYWVAVLDVDSGSQLGGAVAFRATFAPHQPMQFRPPTVEVWFCELDLGPDQPTPAFQYLPLSSTLEVVAEPFQVTLPGARAVLLALHTYNLPQGVWEITLESDAPLVLTHEISPQHLTTPSSPLMVGASGSMAMIATSPGGPAPGSDLCYNLPTARLSLLASLSSADARGVAIMLRSDSFGSGSYSTKFRDASGDSVATIPATQSLAAAIPVDFPALSASGSATGTLEIDAERDGLGSALGAYILWLPAAEIVVSDAAVEQTTFRCGGATINLCMFTVSGSSLPLLFVLATLLVPVLVVLRSRHERRSRYRASHTRAFLADPGASITQAQPTT